MESASQCGTGTVTNNLLQMSSGLGMKRGLALDAFQPFTHSPGHLGRKQLWEARASNRAWLLPAKVWCSQPLRRARPVEKASVLS